MKKGLKCLCLLFAVVFTIAAIPNNASAATKSTAENQMKTHIHEIIQITDDGYKVIHPKNQLLAGENWKYKTKNVYSKATGKLVATLTIQYNTTMEGGRPKFNEVGIDLEFKNNYRGDYEFVTATGDLVVIKVSYNFGGIDSGYQNVSFIP